MIDSKALADEFLASCVAAVTSPPTRQYVSPGRPAHDPCEQLVVWVGNIKPTRANVTANQGRVLKHTPPLVNLQFELTRCIEPMDKKGNPPTAAQLDTNAETIDADADALYTNCLESWGGCTIHATEGVTITEPQGNFVTVRGGVTIQSG